jgi:methionyl-tRNA formyltransferase
VFQLWLNRHLRDVAARELRVAPMPLHATVTSINDCRFDADELVIGFGTSIVSASTLARAPRGILNLHTGWLPDFRGVKSEFWTLARGERDKLGWTLHYMTPRLDEGDIVLRRGVMSRAEDPGTVRAEIMIDAAEMLAAFINEVRRDGFDCIRRRPQGRGAYYTTPTLRDWRAFTRRRAANA